MISHPSRGPAIMLLTVLAMAACRGVPAGTGQPAPQAAPTATSTMTVEQSDQAAIARARADSARLPYTAADIHFMTMMIGHHAQAVRIAAWAATHDASPVVRTLADRILSGQRDEIRTMQQWLRDRQQPVPALDTTGAPMMHHGADHAAGHGAGHAMAAMPGMLSEAQLRELDAARGREFDRLFLTYMIQHHRGAIAMVEELFSSYGAGQDELVFRFATDVNVDQITEIARMEQMLVDLLFGSPPP